MKTVNGKQAIEIMKQYLDEDYYQLSFDNIEETLESNSQSFDVQVLLSDENDLLDYRFYDPYQHLTIPEHSVMYIQLSGWSHWQCESNEAREFENN